MGMAANMAAIVAAALLEHGTSGEAGLLYVSCLSRAPDPTFVTCLGKGIEWIDAGAPGVGAGSGPPSSGLLYMFHVYQARNPTPVWGGKGTRPNRTWLPTRWVPFTRQRARVLYGSSRRTSYAPRILTTNVVVEK